MFHRKCDDNMLAFIGMATYCGSYCHEINWVANSPGWASHSERKEMKNSVITA